MSDGAPVHCLDPDLLNATVERLERRIRERFPQASLARVCHRLLTISQQAKERARFVSEPIVSLRIGTAIAVTAMLSLFVLVPAFLAAPQTITADHFVELSDATLNTVVIIGAAIIFLVSLETRIKRKRALSAIHELRVVAHIIDMHQLTKDPDRIYKRLALTPSSPIETMGPHELTRYLDYCAEMLSLIGKVATLYVQQFHDAVTLAAAKDVEDLTTGLSRKVWQKLMILNATYHPPSPTSAKN